MTRFCDKVGYGISQEKEDQPGVWVDVITEFPYTGTVIRNTRRLDDNEKLNQDINVANSISIVADQYAVEHFAYIKYVRWSGVIWTVTSVEVQSPRLILSLGSVYNGPTA